MKSEMERDILKVLVTEEELKARIAEMGAELYDRFEGKNPLFLGVLKGSFVFMADLVRACQVKSDVEFIAVSSYQNATVSSGRVQITHDLQQDITGRHLIIVEDILDSGNTLAFLRDYFMTKGAASITIVTLLDKPSRRTKAISADLAGGELVCFVHSFAGFGCKVQCTATTEYGAELTAAVQNGNVYGTQFHPEKSGETGLKILKAFCRLEGKA